MQGAQEALLLTKFPHDFVAKKILPALGRAGFPQVRVAKLDFSGDFARYPVVFLMRDMCSHTQCDLMSAAARRAGAKMVYITRRTAEWPAAFASAGVPMDALPAEPESEAPASPRRPKRDRFGDWLAHERVGAGLSEADLAAMLGCDVADVAAWEANRKPVPVGIYGELLVLFPALDGEEAPKAWMRDPESEQRARRSAQAAPPSTALAGVPGRSLNALLFAARVLGLTGPLSIHGSDDGSEVMMDIGPLGWTGPSPDEVLDQAHADLSARLTELAERTEEARRRLVGGS